jgi:hypothetical protein
MNLAGNQAKQLFKSVRTGSSPSVVGLWAAATALDQMRKRSKSSGKELIATKRLKPGQSYVIRMPGKEEGSLAESLAPGTVVAEIETNPEESVPAALLSVATDLLGAAKQESKKPVSAGPRRRRKTSVVPAQEDAPKPGRRERRRAAKAAKRAAEPAEKLNRRQRRKASRAEVEEATPTEETFASSLVDVAASFMGGSDDAPAEEPPVKVSRRRQRRSDRLASLADVEFDRDTLPRRRRRKLNRAERRAQKRPSRGRVRRARKQQKSAATASAKIDRRSEPSRRKRRKIRGAERELDYRRAKVEKRSTRRRRRMLKKAEKALGTLRVP